MTHPLGALVFHCKIGITLGLLRRVEMMCKTPGMWKVLNKWWLVRALANRQICPIFNKSTEIPIVFSDSLLLSRKVMKV